MLGGSGGGGSGLQGQVGAGSAGSLLHGWGIEAPVCPTGGQPPPHLGVMLPCSQAGSVAWWSHFTGASCCFSCEELQDIDLELNVDNSAFYDQFAIAQVGRAAGGQGSRWAGQHVGGAAGRRGCQMEREAGVAGAGGP